MNFLEHPCQKQKKASPLMSTIRKTMQISIVKLTIKLKIRRHNYNSLQAHEVGHKLFFRFKESKREREWRTIRNHDETRTVCVEGAKFVHNQNERRRSQREHKTIIEMTSWIILFFRWFGWETFSRLMFNATLRLQRAVSRTWRHSFRLGYSQSTGCKLVFSFPFAPFPQAEHFCI